MSTESTTTETTPGQFAEIERAEQAASPGPWEPGDVWLVAGLIYDADGNRVAQKAATRCSYCGHGEPEWAGRTDINGAVMKAHRHRAKVPYLPEHRISGPGGGTIAGNYDYEAGGILSAEDTRFICAARSAVPALLAETKRLRTALEEVALRTVQRDLSQIAKTALEGGEDQ